LIEFYGALLVGALGTCDAALERELAPELEVQLPELESVVDETPRSPRRNSSPTPAEVKVETRSKQGSAAAPHDEPWSRGTPRVSV
jgi:hypothetical protein